jgi:3-hydroxymyristoyl/3-hydroxydecanoyl-(acyl carrier protein) dehydratase
MKATDQIEAMALGEPEKVTEPPPGRFFKGEPVFRRRYRLAVDFIAFQGHFEGQPILPAMAQIMLARGSAERLAGELEVASIVQAKFLAPVKPEAILDVFMAPPDKEDGVWLFHLFAGESAASEEVEAARLKIIFKKRGGEA